jgi:putative transcriptional regulator
VWHDDRVPTSLTGKLLVATPRLVDPNFYRTVILVVQHDEQGTLGLVLNRVTMEEAEGYLPTWVDHLSTPGLVHYGGPVEPEVAIGLGLTSQGMYAGVSGLALVDLSQVPEPDAPKIKVYSGYSGWSAGQLEEELAVGSWYVVPAAPDDPFAEPDTLWRKVLRRQSGLLSVISTYPEDPELN